MFRRGDNNGYNAVDLADGSVRFIGPSGIKAFSFDSLSAPAAIVKDDIWEHLLLHTSNGRAEALYGFPQGSLIRLVAQLNRLLGPLLLAKQRQHLSFLRQSYDRQKDLIEAVVSDGAKLLDGSAYIRHDVTLTFAKRAKSVLAITNILEESQLTGPERTLHLDLKELANSIESRRAKANAIYTEREIERFGDLFRSLGENALTTEQMAACVDDELRQQIIAGAGTGKTTTIVCKAAYLVASKKAKPEEILALSYSKLSSNELRAKFDAQDLQAIPVQTVHSLGYKIISETENRRPTVSPIAQDKTNLTLSKLILKFVNELAGEHGTNTDVITFIERHAYPYRSSFSFTNYGQYLEYIRNCELKSLRGETVKSFEEAEIANALFINGVDYVYEKQYEHDLATLEHRQYVPDFYLPEYQIYLEHFGINREGKTAPGIDATRYLREIEWKREVHKSRGTRLIETYSWMRQEGTLLIDLRSLLLENNVKISPRSEAEVLAAAAESGMTTRLATMLASCIGPFRERSGPVAQLKPAVGDPDPSRTLLFFKIFAAVLKKYESMLEGLREIDHSDMVVKAANALRKGAYKPELRYILVDEFQDISPGRGEFLKLLAESCQAALCVVGDDWQAIYNFSGSDGGLFRRFTQHYGYSSSHVLSETFRFGGTILGITSTFIQKNPSQLKKQLRTRRITEPPAVTLLAVDRESAFQEAINLLMRIGIRPKSILAIGRTNMVLDEINNSYDRSILNFDLRAVTAHSSKGLESDAVVVLNASEHRDGYPALRLGDPIRQAFLPDADSFKDAEERRLFYVALTRARNHVVVCYTPDAPSSFIRELEAMTGIESKTVDGKLARKNRVICRACKGGKYVKRQNKLSKKIFYSCSLFPLCTETFRPCPICFGVIDALDGFWQCTSEGCTYRRIRCPECMNGVVNTIPEVKGKYKAFDICSNNRRGDPLSCRYKQNHEAYDSEITVQGAVFDSAPQRQKSSLTLGEPNRSIKSDFYGSLNSQRETHDKANNEALFEALQALRKQLADKRDLPAYVIFPDTTLRAMARDLPTTLGELRRIPGVGDKKLADYGDAFLAALAMHARETGAESA